MADFFQENSEGQTASTTDHHHHHGMQQQNFCFMEQNARFFESSAFPGQETDHQNAGNVLVGLPIPTTTPLNTIHQNYNLWVGLPDSTHDPGRVPDQVHGFEFLSRDQPHPPVTVVSPVTGKRLSLSLSSQQQQQQNSDHILNNSEGNFNNNSNNISLPTGSNGVVFGSKYLKAAQELLDEVVSMGNDMRRVKKNKMKEELVKDKSTENCTGKKPLGDLTTAQRQELQIKKAKLVTMIEEVEQRYRQYQTQMQFIVSSFEQAAGQNAARTYTFLALQTISKQFRCLKDAITSEIKSISKNLGEDDCMGAKGEGLRLRFADHQHHYGQQLRHLGMMHHHHHQHHHHHNAWRPQRGLPERAVSILRAWLFEHFLHPYPRDSDKHMLARQTGLTRSQVSNWFINARVRLWKPMVEEMYIEEIRQQDGNAENTNNDSQNMNLAAECSKSTTVLQNNNNNNNIDSKRETSNLVFNIHNASPTDQCSSSILSSNYLTNEAGAQNSSSSMVSFDLDNRQQRQQQQRQAVLSNYVEGFGQYHTLGDSSGRFYGHGVSLSLGLPRSLSENQRSYDLSDENLSGNIGFGSNQIEFSGFSTAAGDFQSIDDVHVKKRYGSAAMLPDFLA